MVQRPERLLSVRGPTGRRAEHRDRLPPAGWRRSARVRRHGGRCGRGRRGSARLPAPFASGPSFCGGIPGFGSSAGRAAGAGRGLIATHVVAQSLGLPVASVTERPYLYATSHRIDELEVVLADGTRIEL